MPSIASDLTKVDLACNMKGIRNPSISRVPAPLLEYQYISGKIVEWRLHEVKQHKYKLVLGWVTVWLVVLL